ncbi:MAG: transcriptional regulator, LysR family [Herminiimonas sp.]|nr:transcriptional regulator, LysR family [Herminiimonas sp.]
MSRRLPPLTTLRAFEAAARHSSFASAADELSITPAAVSQQVRHLEDHLSVRLFTRHARRVEVTAAGADYARTVGAMLDQLALATERIQHADRVGRLTIATTPSLAAQWLMPRLIRFLELHPELDVRLSTSNALVDFERQDVEVAVRYGDGRWPGLQSELLIATELFPVCSPSFRQGAQRLRIPANLRPRSLLRLMSNEWPKWLEAAGLGDMRAEGPQYSDVGLLTQAAVAGQGVALGQSIIVADDLADGRLIEPFNLRIPSQSAYYIVGLPGDLERPKVRAFSQWLRKELARDDRSP